MSLHDALPISCSIARSGAFWFFREASGLRSWLCEVGSGSRKRPSQAGFVARGGALWPYGGRYFTLHRTMPVVETVAESFVKRSEEHTSELQSPMRTSYAVFCLKKKTTK